MPVNRFRIRSICKLQFVQGIEVRTTKENIQWIVLGGSPASAICMVYSSMLCSFAASSGIVTMLLVIVSDKHVEAECSDRVLCSQKSNHSVLIPVKPVEVVVSEREGRDRNAPGAGNLHCWCECFFVSTFTCPGAGNSNDNKQYCQ